MAALTRTSHALSGVAEECLYTTDALTSRRSFHWAVKMNSINTLDKCVAWGWRSALHERTDVDLRLDDQRMPPTRQQDFASCSIVSMEALHLSAMLGHPEIVVRLLDLGADISSKVTLTTGAWTRCMTPLMFALLWKRTGAARVLLERGASQEVCVVRRELHNGIVAIQGEFTALICAIHASVKPVVDILLSQPNPMLGNSPGCGYSPLHLACGLDLDRVKFIQPLLDAGADPGLGCRHLEKPMCLLAQMTNQRVAIDGMEALLAAGANVDDHNESDTCTPLEFAAMHSHLDTIQFLLKNFADPNGYNPTIVGQGRPVQTARSIRWVLNGIETRDKVSQGPHPAFLCMQHLVRAGAIVRAEFIESSIASLSPEMMNYLCAQAEDLPKCEQGWYKAYETLSKASCFYAGTVTLLFDRFPLPHKETPLTSPEMRQWRMLYFQMLQSPLIKHRRMFAELLRRLKGHFYSISGRNVLLCLLSNPSFWYADHGDAFSQLLEAVDVDVNYRRPSELNCLGVFLVMAAQRPLRWLDNNFEAVLDRLLSAGVQLLVVDVEYVLRRIRRKNCWRALLEPLMLRVADPDRVKLITDDRYMALMMLESTYLSFGGRLSESAHSPKAHRTSNAVTTLGFQNWKALWNECHPERAH